MTLCFHILNMPDICLNIQILGQVVCASRFQDVFKHCLNGAFLVAETTWSIGECRWSRIIKRCLKLVSVFKFLSGTQSPTQDRYSAARTGQMKPKSFFCERILSSPAITSPSVPKCSHPITQPFLEQLLEGSFCDTFKKHQRRGCVKV